MGRGLSLENTGEGEGGGGGGGGGLTVIRRKEKTEIYHKIHFP